MIIVKATKSSETGALPSEKLLAEPEDFSSESRERTALAPETSAQGLKAVSNPRPQTADQATKATALPQQPEDWPGLFVRNLNAGNLEAILALYEPEARFVAPSGETMVETEISWITEAQAHFFS